MPASVSLVTHTFKLPSDSRERNAKCHTLPTHLRRQSSWPLSRTWYRVCSSLIPFTFLTLSVASSVTRPCVGIIQVTVHQCSKSLFKRGG